MSIDMIDSILREAEEYIRSYVSLTTEYPPYLAYRKVRSELTENILQVEISYGVEGNIEILDRRVVIKMWALSDDSYRGQMLLYNEDTGELMRQEEAEGSADYVLQQITYWLDAILYKTSGVLVDK